MPELAVPPRPALVTLANVHRDVFAGLLLAGAGAHGEDAPALGLLLRRVRQHDAADRCLFLIEDLDDQAVTKRLQVHPLPSCSDDFVTTTGTLLGGVPGHSSVR